MLQKNEKDKTNMQIVICDDLKSTIQDLEQLLLSYEKENNLDFHISYFTTPSELYPYLKKTPVDVIFMDLDFGMEAEDGILWSTKIHQDFPKTLVLILTAYENRFKEGFVARAFRFMAKPVCKKELYSNLDACREELNLYKTVTLSNPNLTLKVSAKEILYFEARKNGCYIKTEHTIQKNDKSLLHWESQVPPTLFFRCHKKYLVNFHAVKQIRNHMLLLKNGEKIPVSRRKWTLLKIAFMKFDIALKGREGES